MYRMIVRRQVRGAFRSLSRGDAESVLGRFAPSIRFFFSGTHVMGGEREGVEAVRQWFQLVFALFPGIQIEPRTVVVNGWPWNTVVATHFTVRATLRDGRAYRNEGMQLLRLRWGRIVEDRLYEDTQLLDAELNQMADQGVREAVAQAA
jgi:ketosteroid isomerase-like protein